MPATATYDLYELGLMPTSLRGPNGEAWATGCGLFKDAFPEAAILAVKCRWANTCPEDALPFIGQDRSLERYPTETTAAYRTRLLNAWVAWSAAGTKGAIITALNQLGYSNVSVKENVDWPNSPSPGFAVGQEWWRFWVIIDRPHGFTPAGLWGDGGTWGSGRVWGVGGTAGAVQAIRATVNKWKPAHAKLVNIIVILSGVIVGGGWTVGGGTVVGGSAAAI